MAPTRKKIIWRVLGGLVIATMVGGFVLYSSLGRIAKHAIEYYGPTILGVSVKVASVSLSPFSGRGEIKGLVVGNPAGFNEPYLIRADRVKISVEVISLTSNKIHIYLVELEKPEVTWEGGFADSNITRVQKHAAEFAASTVPKAERTIAGSKKPKWFERKFVMDRLAFKNTQAIAHLKGTTSTTLPVADFEMKDIGKSTNGIPIATVVTQVIDRLTSAVVGAMAKSPALGVWSGIKSGAGFIQGIFSKPKK